ncbi:SusC/RagA family TonB-linked outer membrane protein [Pedobacter frigoris]|uniref:SusC/RagA family TonB-linked outer membrane protein n=1 Tax=Pedobacter frigoris TaxID=2571272 RepID=A0A4U1CD50_9SPHI|nr:SusC/RagA family TonB-linked outer membrane protein [Pedobacter frigoris]TKC04874.1 SusC/RagA family TonB-linked outer membrane protein [Pedobacter frigoris]
MKRLVQSLFILLFMAGTAMAQDRTVTGTVTGKDDGLPLPGVSVLVQGTKNGTQTGADGKFVLSVPSGSQLTFSYLGYLPQTVAVGASNVVTISLEPDSKTLSEVVVTALGISREKKTLGYSTQTVKADDIVNSREVNIVNALAGKVAGAQINNSGGQAGSSSRIVLRGTTSLTGENQPLFIIDGIPMDNSVNRGISASTEDVLFNGTGGNRAVDIDPNTIATVNILKGAAGSALYGSRGANGVIIITTKRGQKDATRKIPRVSFSSSLALDDAFTKGYQASYLQGSLGLYKNGLPPGLGGYSEAAGGAPQSSASWGPHKDSVSQAVITAIGMPKVLDPRESFYRTGKVWNNSVSLSGGGESSSYILTYSNLNQEGVVPTNTYKRNSVTANFTGQLTKDFNSSTSINYTNSANNRMPEGNTKRSYLYSLNFAPISFDSKEQYGLAGNRSWTNAAGFNNPYWLLDNIAMPSKVDRFVVSNESTLTLTPWLKLTNRVGLDTYTDNQKEQVNIGTISIPKGRMFDALINYRQINNDLLLNADRKLNEDMNISGFVGFNVNQRTFARRTVRGLDLSIPGFYDITSAQTTEALQNDEKRRSLGLYASVSFDYKNYLFINATARNDWSSTLPVGENSFFYPSVSGSFVFSELLPKSDYFSYGKLRLGIAQAGNDAPAYYTQQTYTLANPSDGTRGNIAFPYNGTNGFLTSNSLASNTITPEKVTEQEVGLELKFFKNRLSVDGSFYNKVSRRQIIQQEIASSSGYVQRTINAGEISNKGIELIVSATPIKTQDFAWDVSFNFAKNKYKLKSLAEGVDNIFLAGFENPQIRADKDYGYGVIWGTRFARNDAGQLLIDDDGLPTIADDLGPIGNVTPDWTGGLRSTFTYKGLSLSGLLDIRHGGDILNFDLYYSTFYGTAKVTEQRNTTRLWEGVRISDGAPNTTKVLQDQDYFQTWYTTSYETLVEDGGFAKLREVTLSYALPQSLLGKTPFEAVSFSVTGRNLWIKSNFSFGDPEGSLLGNGNAQGFYHAVTPGTKGVTFGLNVKF